MIDKHVNYLFQFWKENCDKHVTSIMGLQISVMDAYVKLIMYIIG